MHSEWKLFEEVCAEQKRLKRLHDQQMNDTFRLLDEEKEYRKTRMLRFLQGK